MKERKIIRQIAGSAILAVTVAVAFVAAAGSEPVAHADEIQGSVTASGAAVTAEVPQETPLQPAAFPPIGTVTIQGVKKAASLKEATLTWSQTGEGEGCVIMRKTGKGAFAEIARVADGTPGNKTYVDRNVKPGKTYTYQVYLWRTQTDGTVENGVCTNSMSVKLIPGKIKGLKAKKGRGKITVTWKKTKNITGYQVYTKVFVKGIKLKYSKARTLKAKTRKYKRGMLVKGMKYGFKVRTYKKVNGKKIYGPFATVTKRY